MNRATLVSLVAVPILINPLAPLPAFAADLKLPPKFAGKTETVGVGTFSLSWELLVDEVTADGIVRGKMTYPGRACGAKDAPFVGKYDGTNFTIDPVPFHLGNAMYCKGWVFPFVRKGDANRFEAIVNASAPNGNPMTLKITLDPQ